MKIPKNFFFICLAVICACTFFCGCSLKVSLSENKSGEINFSFDAKISGAIKATLIELSSTQDKINGIEAESGEQKNLNSILNTEAIQNELNASFENSYVAVTDDDTFILKTKLKSLKSLPFAKTEQGSQNKKMILSISPDAIYEAFLKDNPSAKKYTAILMAPLFGDEEMTPEEYSDLLASVYGEDFAVELTGGSIEIEFIPYGGKKLVQKIPVSELLTLSGTKEIVFEY